MITMIVLAGVFLAVVVPQALAARADRQQQFVDSIQFHAGAMQGRGEGAGHAGPTRQPRSSLARRKTIFVLLLVSMAVTAVAALVTPSKATLVGQLGVDNCFLAYVGLLVRRRDARAPSLPPAPAPGLVLAAAQVRPALRAS